MESILPHTAKTARLCAAQTYNAALRARAARSDRKWLRKEPAQGGAPAPAEPTPKKKKSMWGKLRGAVRASPKKSPKASKAPAAPAPAVAPTAAPAVDHRARLVAFYEKHNPAKLDSIDATLAKYAGRESELFEALRAKYEAPAAVEEKSDAPSVEYVT